MTTGSVTTIVPQHVPGWAALAAGSSRGGHGARESSSGCGAQQRDGTGLSLGGKGLEKQIAPALGWEQIAGQGEEEEEGFGGRETVLFENLLKNAIQEAILNTYVLSLIHI